MSQDWKGVQGRRAIQYCKAHKVHGGDREHNGREMRPRIWSCYGELQAERHFSFTDRKVDYQVDGREMTSNSKIEVFLSSDKSSMIIGVIIDM
jgi:hypothetical protein